MRELLLVCACAALIAVPLGVARAEPVGGAAKQTTQAPAKDDAEHVEPGKVGPGSEKNSQVSPTSPDIPAHKQPPPDINLPANGESSRDREETQERPVTIQPPNADTR